MWNNDDVQRTEQWFEDRKGIPTASMFNAVMTAPRTKKDKEAGKLSDTAFSYAVELVKQRLTGEFTSVDSAATRWGSDHESFAIEAYQEVTNEKVLECGFVRHSDFDCGASPDGLIGLNGGVEIKCPFNSVNHIKTFHTGQVPSQYVAQVQGQMWVLNLDWIDFVSYDPRMPKHSKIKIIRVERDQEFIDRLEESIKSFTKFLDKLEAELTGDIF
jgi:putative phage-type endonuclease